jgi:RNA polymerase sigma factor (sigma-70 family)
MTPVLAKRLGADRSFERLYRKHVGDVYRYALVVLHNEADAEDVTQTTFLNAYRAMENGERPRAPQNWLIAIAHNVCRQRFRQSQRRPNEVAFEDELAETVVDEDAVTAEDIRRALGHLAFNQRAALVMRELEGRSYQEIAEILGTTVSAVETLIFRARRALREQLEDGITCHEAELAISRQLDGRLSRKHRGTLRAHLRECDDCAGFARSQRAQRGALKALGAIPLPPSLAGLFGGGGASVGGGLAVKAAAVAAGAAVVTGVGYEGVKHGIVHSHRPAAAPAAVREHHAAAPPRQVARHAAVIAPSQEARHDQKPFRQASVTARRVHRELVERTVRVAPARPAKPRARQVSPPPPSGGHELAPVEPARPEEPPKEHGPKANRGHDRGRRHRPEKQDRSRKEHGPKANRGHDRGERHRPEKQDKPNDHESKANRGHDRDHGPNGDRGHDRGERQQPGKQDEPPRDHGKKSDRPPHEPSDPAPPAPHGKSGR